MKRHMVPTRRMNTEDSADYRRRRLELTPEEKVLVKQDNPPEWWDDGDQ